MTKVVGDIAVQVGADVSGLQHGMARAGRSVKGFDRSAAKMGANIAKVGAAVAVAFTAMAAGAARMASSAATTAKEIQNLSNVVGVSATEFQRSAQAAKTVGIEQEKLADIFKDVNDKFGDFMATGAGPLADFFEKIAPQVGVTASQFARLSGPDALQLYVSSLEKAGVSQQQMTFYMEALASDATALLPLLRDNGSEMQRLGDAAARSGRIMSNEAVAGGAALDDKLSEMATTLKTQLNQAILDNSDDILDLAQTITDDWIPALISVAGFIGDVVKVMTQMIAKIAQGVQKVIEFGAAVKEHFSQETTGSKGRKGRRDGDIPRLEPVPFDSPVLQPVPFDGPTISPVPPVLPQGSGGGGRSDESSGGGGSSGLMRDDFENLRSRFATQAEIIEEQRVAALEKLREFRDAQLVTEQEYNETEARIKQDHMSKLADIEARAQDVRRQAVSGALGDLASLMQTENKKLFKIGQAAAIAEATVSGYKSAVSAWEKGMEIGGPTVAAAFTALSLAKTGSLISSISSASASGSSGAAAGGGAAAGAASAAPAAAAQPATQRSLTLIGDRFNRKQAMEIAEFMNDGADNGLVIRGGRR